MRVDSFRMDEGEKQPINAIPSKKTIGMDHATRSLGLLAGQAKESPDCWDRCEETEQLFYGAEPLRGESFGSGAWQALKTIT
jgi:hypothetical protein